MMGARHALTVMRVWDDLGHAPLRLLTHMALTAKDSDPDPRYYGGHAAKAAALGYRDPDVKAARVAVERHMKALRDAGAVEVTRSESPNRPPEYRLVLARNDPRSPMVVDEADDPWSPMVDNTESAAQRPSLTVPTTLAHRSNDPRSPMGKGVRGELQDEKSSVFSDLVTPDGTALAKANNPEELAELAQTRYHVEVSDADLRRYFEHEDGDDPKTAARIDRLNECRDNYRCSLADDDRRRDAVARAIDVGDNRRRHHVLRHIDTTHRHECPVWQGPRRTA